MGVVYYVDVTTGLDTDTGLTEALAWQTLHHAIDSMSDGDKCWVKASADYVVEDGANDCILYTDTAAGEYYTFEGYHTTPGDGGVATLNADTNTLAYCIGNSSYNAAQYITFKYIRLTGASSHGHNQQRFHSFYVCCSDNNGGVGFYNSYSGFCIGCLAYNNTSSGYQAQALLVFCISHGNGTSEVQVNGPCIGLLAYDATTRVVLGDSTDRSAILINSTLDGDNAVLGIDNTSAGERPWRVLNNIVFDCSTGFSRTTDHGDYELINNNFLYSNATDYTNCADYGDDVDGTEDPFVDSANRDYRLKSNSEAKAKGMDVHAIKKYWDSFFADEGAPIMGVSTTDIGAIQSNPHRTAKQRRHGV